jgi:hypothetical protein
MVTARSRVAWYVLGYAVSVVDNQQRNLPAMFSVCIVGVVGGRR